MKNELIKDFQSTGPCAIDLDVLEKIWDHRCLLTQWNDDFRFIRYLRRGSACCQNKLTISQEHAREIIARLDLVPHQEFLASAKSWRKADWDFRSMMPSGKKKSHA